MPIVGSARKACRKLGGKNIRHFPPARRSGAREVNPIDFAAKSFTTLDSCPSRYFMSPGAFYAPLIDSRAKHAGPGQLGFAPVPLSELVEM